MILETLLLFAGASLVTVLLSLIWRVGSGASISSLVGEKLWESVPARGVVNAVYFGGWVLVIEVAILLLQAGYLHFLAETVLVVPLAHFLVLGGSMMGGLLGVWLFGRAVVTTRCLCGGDDYSSPDNIERFRSSSCFADSLIHDANILVKPWVLA